MTYIVAHNGIYSHHAATGNGSGNPTTIEYYVCKLASGTYSWVAV